MNEPANFGWSCRCPQSDLDDPEFTPNNQHLSDKTICMVARQGENNELRHYDVHDLYGWSETKPTFEAAQLSTGTRGFVITRSTYPSSGQWSVHWLGDNASRWVDLH